MAALTELRPAPSERAPKVRPSVPKRRPAAATHQGGVSHPTAPVVLPAAGSEVLAAPREWLWTPEFYQQAYEAGFFEGLRVELVKGRVYVMAAMGDKHVLGIRLADAVAHTCFPIHAGHVIECQLPKRLDESTPEPDLTILSGQLRDLNRDPKRVLLVVEVSDTSLRFDQVVKAATYAEAGYPDYWITNIPENRVEIRREPRRAPDGTWAYAQLTTHGPGEVVSPLADPNVKIAVDDLLP